MGQQQLLLLLLGIIIIGISILLGISFFNEKSASSNRDALSLDMQKVATLAISHYKNISALGGGDYSYNGFVLPNSFKNTENGTISDPNITDGGQKITLEATGTNTGNDNTSKVKLKAEIDSKGNIVVTVVN